MTAIQKIAKKYLGTEKIEDVGICAMVENRPKPIKLKLKKGETSRKEIENFFKNRRE